MDDNEVRTLFLTLWDKAVGTPTYDKSEWKRMDAVIDTLTRERDMARKALQDQIEFTRGRIEELDMWRRDALK